MFLYSSITLVFGFVNAFFDDISLQIFVKFPSDIMPCCDIIHPQQFSPFQKGIEFNKPVAVNAGIGCVAVDVGIVEPVNDIFLEPVAEIIHIMVKTKFVSHITSVLDIIKGTASFLPVKLNRLPRKLIFLLYKSMKV